ncbi:hypothetical protein D1872_294710 [compost metagenome]
MHPFADPWQGATGEKPEGDHREGNDHPIDKAVKASDIKPRLLQAGVADGKLAHFLQHHGRTAVNTEGGAEIHFPHTAFFPVPNGEIGRVKILELANQF